MLLYKIIEMKAITEKEKNLEIKEKILPFLIYSFCSSLNKDTPCFEHDLW